MRNLQLCHWSSQLFDLRAQSSTDVPALLLNQPTVWVTRGVTVKRKIRLLAVFFRCSNHHSRRLPPQHVISYIKIILLSFYIHVGTNSLLRQALARLVLPMLKPECMLQLMPLGDRYLSVNGKDRQECTNLLFSRHTESENSVSSCS